MPGAEPDELTARARAWSRYWRSGVRHSCPGSFRDHYGAATQSFWRSRFGALTAQDRILELGCGNGSLIQWLDHAGSVWPLAVDAVDLAQLDHGWLQRLAPGLRERVRLHSGTSAAELPLADASVTQIFSQYALEYFADDDCWRELSRVLAPKATLAAIVHHQGSHLCRLARFEAADGDWLLAPGGPLDLADEMLPWLAMSADPAARARRAADPRAVSTRDAFNAAYAALGERMAAAEFPDLLRDIADRVMHILRTTADSAGKQAHEALCALRADLMDNQLRVSELVTCALDREGIEVWRQRVSQLGCAEVEIGEISEQGYLFGWRIVASRA